MALSSYSTDEENVSQVNLQVVVRIIVLDRRPRTISIQSSFMRFITKRCEEAENLVFAKLLATPIA